MILLEPLRTEKAINKLEFERVVTFIVTQDASKPEIAKEFERVFGIRPEKVNTLNRDGKKIAYIKLSKEANVDELARKLKYL